MILLVHEGIIVIT